MRRHPATTFRLISMIIICVAILEIDFSEEIKWITNPRTINVCNGSDADLLWKFDEEETTISSLEWYFNKTLICTSSETETLTVRPPYQDRIERLNRTDIRLKHVSLVDEGVFVLFPLLEWSTSQSMQDITLQVLEPPTHKCTCKINCTGHVSKLTCELTIPDCGRPQVTAVWKRKETLEVLGQGNHFFINSSFHDKEILCCPAGSAMKCVDDPHQFCEPIQIPYRDDESPSTDGKSIIHVEPAITRAPNHRDTECTNSYHIQLFVLPIIALTVYSVTAIFSLCAVIIIYRLKRRIKELERKLSTHREQHQYLECGQEEETILAVPSILRAENQNVKNDQEPKEYIPLLQSYSGQHDDCKNDQNPSKRILFYILMDTWIITYAGLAFYLIIPALLA